MRVNLVNGFMVGYTGSETWSYTMAKYLSRKHDVTVVTPRMGKLSDKIDFCPVTEEWVDCDLAIVNHAHGLVPNGVPMIYTCHSVWHTCEQFPDRRCMKATPQGEVARRYKLTDNVHLIHQPIDLERFKPTKINKEPKKILYLCNPGYAEGHGLVKEAFWDKGLIFIEEQVFDIENVIKDADVVIATARGAYESLACGKNVICADKRSYKDSFMGAGMITEQNFDTLLECNLSGRNVNKRFTAKKLRAELKKYDSKRRIDMSMFDAEKIADQYLKLYEG